MRINYVGNFEPPHSTENHVKLALEALGHTVNPLQEQLPSSWAKLLLDTDLVLWTATQSLHLDGPQHLALLQAAAVLGVPTVAFHLDRWWGLEREHRVLEHPMFRCQFVFTADGGHQDLFLRAGVNHLWAPPAVSEFECAPGQFQRKWAAPLAFVGNTGLEYHPEWQHRQELVRFLDARGCKFVPGVNLPGIRGDDLRNLYASTEINVGDSCLVGDATHYWSDRVPETLGRGGFLLHPNVEGLEQHFTPGKHLQTWDLGDWDQLGWWIDHYSENPDERKQVAQAGRQHVLANHTYTVRMAQVLGRVFE